MKSASIMLAGLAAMEGSLSKPEAPHPALIRDRRTTRSRSRAPGPRRPAGSKLARMAKERRLGLSTIR
jgi:hypothetical protein